MRQSLAKAIDSSTHLFNPPPSLYTYSCPIPKCIQSISKHACKISRRDLTIRMPPSSLLIILGACCDVVFDPFRARADEGPSDIGDGSEVDLDKRQTKVNNGGGEENATSDREEIRSNESPNSADGGIEENPNAEREVGLEEGPARTFNGKKANSSADGCGEKTTTQRAFLDISIDEEPAGRIIIGLYRENAPAGTARFSGLLSGAAGISYRKKEFVKIVPNYIQHGGVRSYGVDAELARRTGSGLAVDSLEGEWEKVSDKCPGTKNVAGTVGIIVRDPSKPPPKLKLVARKGKLEIDQEDVGKDPNGTEFVISTKDSPELDSSTLVIGRVIEGMDVVKKISMVKTVQENTGSPYFRVAKLIGDKRAVVAERGFNRPFSKVIISNCGLIN